MSWNWQQKDWPHFRYHKDVLAPFETTFLKAEGMLLGAFQHLNETEKTTLKIEILTTEALKTSEIEGEYLNRASVQSSLRRHFDLQPSPGKVPPAEEGICDMMVDLYRNYQTPLTHENLFLWHEKLMQGQTYVREVGRYRTHAEPMQVVSGYLHAPRVHFETPPSSQMTYQMEAFRVWFEKTAPSGGESMAALTRAGIAHLYFVCIHPFEDGNGRIARALAEKALAQTLGGPSLIALAHTIERGRKAYYNALESANKSNEITPWLTYFAQVILDAQAHTQRSIAFLIYKTKLYDHLRGHLNARQEKVLARLFQEGPDGFKGGLSADNYLRLTKASRATATRDLSELVTMGALTKTGEKRHTRYQLSFLTQEELTLASWPRDGEPQENPSDDRP